MAPMVPPMDVEERDWLLAHLQDQAATLVTMADSAAGRPGSAERLIAVRDQMFAITETLGTLEVPHALDSRADWSAALAADRAAE